MSLVEGRNLVNFFGGQCKVHRLDVLLNSAWVVRFWDDYVTSHESPVDQNLRTSLLILGRKLLDNLCLADVRAFGRVCATRDWTVTDGNDAFGLEVFY